MYIVFLAVWFQGCSTATHVAQSDSNSFGFASSSAINDTMTVHVNWTAELNGTVCPIINDARNSNRRLIVMNSTQNFTVKLSCSFSETPKEVANRSQCLNATSDAVEIASLFSLCPKESPLYTTKSPWTTTTFRHRHVFGGYHRQYRNPGCFQRRFKNRGCCRRRFRYTLFLV